MTTVELLAMKVAELKAYCEENGISVLSKDPKKPTKAEYTEAIKTVVNVEEVKKEEPKEDKPKKVLTKAEKRAIKRKVQNSELMPKVRVIIRDNRRTQTPSEFEYITWGNDLIGHQTDRIVFDKPWHVREGALRSLEKATTRVSVPSNNGDNNKPTFRDGPMYSIQRLNPLTEAERAVIAKRQTIMESSAVDLVSQV
jgi:hypothetical protein